VSESEIEELLRGASLRVTRPRVAVLTVIHEVPHADVPTIAELVRQRLGGVSTQAVYDVLKVLVDAGLARRIDLPQSPARYEVSKGDGHHHVVCRSCGTISDVDAPAGVGVVAPGDHGFATDAVEVTYWGVCPGCQGPQDEEELAS